MNTNPDEAKLALWLDDELEGDELAAFESREVTPERLKAREEVRRWRETLGSVLVASEEPPYPDFFNSRIARSLKNQGPTEVMEPRTASRWSSWILPLAACVGMAFTFWMGKFTGTVITRQVAAPAVESRQPVVYTPDGSVDAEWSSSESGTVIILQGVAAIPDATDFSETVFVPTAREADSTAGGRDTY